MLHGNRYTIRPGEWFKLGKWNKLMVAPATHSSRLWGQCRPGRQRKSQIRSSDLLERVRYGTQGMFPSEQVPSLAEFLIVAIYATAKMFNIGTHPGMPINVIAAISGTEYSGKWAASNLLVTCTFAAALGNWCLTWPLYFSFRVGSTRRARRVVHCPVLYSYPLHW